MAIVVLPIDASGGAPAYSAQQVRQAQSALLGAPPSTRPLGARSGVRPGTLPGTVFLSGGGSTTWNVAAHSGVLDTESPAAAAPYFYATDGTDTGAITAAPSSPNSRVDVIWVSVDDTVQDGSGLRGGEVGYSAGTAGTSPVAPVAGGSGATLGTPAVPARAIILATINVPSAGGGSPTVSWVAPYTTAAGGKVIVRTQAERDAIMTSPYDGLMVYRQDSNNVEIYNGSSWDVFSPMRPAQANASLAGNTFGTGVVGTVGVSSITSQSGPAFSISGGTKVVVADTGTYLVTVKTTWSGAVGTGRSFMQILRASDSTILGRASLGPSEDTTSCTVQVTLPATGDGVLIQAMQTSGGTLNIAGTLVMTKISN